MILLHQSTYIVCIASLGYHATWRPDQELFSRSTRSNQAMTVEPRILGADAEEGRRQNPTAEPSFLDHSETWQYVAGSISTQAWRYCQGKNPATFAM